jgi:hypothetical protein
MIPETLRVAFWCDDVDRLEAPLAELGFSVAEQARRARSRIVEWRSDSASCAATVTVERHEGNEDIACCYFAGRDRVEVAVDLAARFSFIPMVLLHAAARGAKTATERAAALTVLAQSHLDRGAGSVWTAAMETTVTAAARDSSPMVRSRAAMAAYLGRADKGAELVRRMLRDEPDPQVRAALEGLPLEGTGGTGETADPLPAPKLRRILRLPALVVEPLETTVERFDASQWVSPIKRRGDMRIARLRDSGGEKALLKLVLHRMWGVCCAFASGEQRASLALRASRALRCLPLELAKVAALASKVSEQRVRAILALALSEHAGIARASRMRRLAVAKVFRLALLDKEPEVRGAALLALETIGESITGDA